jgi:hypothetical protein
MGPGGLLSLSAAEAAYGSAWNKIIKVTMAKPYWDFLLFFCCMIFLLFFSACFILLDVATSKKFNLPGDFLTLSLTALSYLRLQEGRETKKRK